MPWLKKSGAPDWAYPIEVVRAMITGTDEAWLSDWLWLLPGVPTAVQPLCQAGPRTCEPFTELDFLGTVLSGNRAGAAINLLQLVPKLQCFAEQRLFSAYCEEILPGSQICMQLDRVGYWFWATTTWPKAGAQRGDITYTVRDPVGGATSALAQVFGCSDGAHGSPILIDQVDHMVPGEVTHYDVDLSPGGTWLAAGGQNYPTLGGQNITVDICIMPYATVDYEPPPLVRPPTAISPPAGDYPDLPAVGAELDRIERKLEILLEDAATRQVVDLWPLVPTGTPFAVANDEDIDIPEGGGLIVAVTNIGNQTDEQFGAPLKLHRLGRVTVGSASAWLSPFEITVSPMMLVGLPLEVSRARIHVMPPAVASVQLLQRASPVG